MSTGPAAAPDRSDAGVSEEQPPRNAAAAALPRWVWSLYTALCVARVVSAVAGLGYVHPDEHFQSSEIAAADLAYAAAGCCGGQRTTANETLSWGSSYFIPWEFRGSNPIRSVTTVALLSHVPAALVRLADSCWATFKSADLGASCCDGMSPWARIAVQRLWVCGLSFVVDGAVASVCAAHRVRAIGPLLAVAASWVTLVLLVRPFSNTAETLVFAAAIWLVFGTHARGSKRTFAVSFQRAVGIGAVLCFGVFVRFTFAGLAAPLALCLCFSAWHHSSKRWRPPFIVLAGLALGAMITGVVCCLVDSLYFWGIRLGSMDEVDNVIAGRTSAWSIDVFGSVPLRLTPLQAVLYNLDSTNLATHGIHARWTHAAVNLPLMFGLLPAIILWQWLSKYPETSSAKQESSFNANTFPQRLPLSTQLALIFVASTYLAILSSAPHQEPRFLAPLLVCAALLAGPSLVQPGRRQLLLVLWVLSNSLLAVFYGGFHQAGVLGATNAIVTHARTQHQTGSVPQRCSPSSSATCVAFVGTYMPPRAPLFESLAPFPVNMMSFNGATSSSDVLDVLLHFLPTRGFKADEVPESHKCSLVYIAASRHAHKKLAQADTQGILSAGTFLSSSPHFCGEEPLDGSIFDNMQVVVVAPAAMTDNERESV